MPASQPHTEPAHLATEESPGAPGARRALKLGALVALAPGNELLAWTQRLRPLPLRAERWRKELLLPSPDHVNRFLLLWPPSERVESRDGNPAMTFGPWELMICG